MDILEFWTKKHTVIVQIVLLCAATLFLSIDINRPLVDYDEATYAKVVVDTLHTGQVIDLYHFNQPWFEKPPLYLWTVMGSVALFGEHEFAFRIPSVFFTALCCWFLYLLVMELTGDILAAVFGFLVLLTSNSFFVFAREVRLDSAVIAAILAALYFFIKSWREDKFLLFVPPAIAVGFLCKSVIVLLTIPIIFVYASVYQKWGFLRSRYFWIGILAAIIIWAPWHIIETLRFGSSFWNDYVGRQVFARASTTITGTNNIWDYVSLIVPWYLPWNIILGIGLFTLGILAWTRRKEQSPVLRYILLPFCIALSIIVLFTAAKTHLGPYIMPAFPFFAISIALGFSTLAIISHRAKVMGILIMLLGVVAGVVMNLYTVSEKNTQVTPYTYDERAIGETYRATRMPQVPLYAFGWPAVETFNYYGNTQAKVFNINNMDGNTLRGPFFLAMNFLPLTGSVE